MRATPVFAYRLPEETFERGDRFWISSSTVEPLELVDRHAKADIELAADDDLPALWQRVIASTLDFSGIRLRNASMAR
jgi:hypothetical protein